MRTRSTFALVVLSLVCVSVSARAGVNRFTNISPDGGRTSAIAIDPVNTATVYAGTSAGVFKSIDAGESWSLSADFVERGVTSLAIDPIQPSTLYAGTNSGEVMKTVDGGVSWFLLTGIDLKYAIHELIVDPSHPATVYAMSFDGVLRSGDGGVSWSSRSPAGTGVFLSLAIDPSRPSRLYVGADNGFYVTNDEGQAWSLLLPSGLVIRIAVDPNDSAVVHVGYGHILASTNDMGSTWTTLNVGDVHAIEVDPLSSAAYALTPWLPSRCCPPTRNPQSLLVTTDRGRTWKPQATELSNATLLAIDPTKRGRFYAASAENLFKSEDGAVHWRRINSGIRAAYVQQVMIDPTEPSTLFAATASGVVKSLDSGKHWSEEKLLGRYGLAIDPRNPSRLFAFNRETSARSVDGGESWTTIVPGKDVAEMVVASDSAHVYALLHNGVVARSSDGGSSWVSSGFLPLSGYYGLNGGAIAVDPVIPTTVYAAGGAAVIKSTDAGTTWQTVLTDPTDNLGRRLVIDPRRPSTVYAVSSFKVFRSDNEGQSWQVLHSFPYSGNDQFSDLAIDPAETSRLYLAGSFGLLLSEDRGEHWAEFSEGLPTRSVNGVTVDSLGNVYASTARGLFVYSSILSTSDSVSLRTHAGNFVSATDCGGSDVNANATAAGRCEKFVMFDLNGEQLKHGDFIHLRAASGAFVVAEDGGSTAGSAAPVNANRGRPGPWELFVIRRTQGGGQIVSGDSVSLQSWSGSYVVAENGGSNGCQCDSRLNANRSRVGSWETFVIIVH